MPFHRSVSLWMPGLGNTPSTYLAWRVMAHTPAACAFLPTRYLPFQIDKCSLWLTTYRPLAVRASLDRQWRVRMVSLALTRARELGKVDLPGKLFDTAVVGQRPCGC